MARKHYKWWRDYEATTNREKVLREFVESISHTGWCVRNSCGANVECDNCTEAIDQLSNFLELKEEPIGKGIWKYINLDRLIERIYIAPETPNWFAQLVENIIKKYEIEAEIIKSHLENEPFY